jgi:spore germination protein KA
MSQNKKGFSAVLDIITYKKENEPKEFYIPEPDQAQRAEAYENSKAPQGDSLITNNFQENLQFINQSFDMKNNQDVKIREFVIAGRYRAFITFITGMVDDSLINDSILKPLLITEKLNNFNQNCTLDIILSEIIEINVIKKVTDKNEVISEILSGNTILYVDGCDYFISSLTTRFEKRNVDTPQVESVITGPHEGFNETLRTNVTLIRRRILNKNLIVEYMKIGTRNQVLCSVVYMKDIVNPAIVNEVKRRINGIKSDYVDGGEMLTQFIEDHPYSIFPTILTTERPDKTVSHILEGRVAILVEGMPFADIVPITFTSFMHSSDDVFARWQYGTFIRVMRFATLLIAILLPGIYLAVTNFHQEMIPTELLIAIAKSKENVPFPVIVEVVLMEISFELIREAGIRMPGIIGNTLGIIGALILGQAAVQANIVSPVLIIVVSVTGLSNFAIPSYSFAFSIRILRFVFIIAGTLLGFFGITVAWITISCLAFNMKSFGVNFFAPVAPVAKQGKDYLIRYPVWEQEKRPDYLNTLDTDRQPKESRAWAKEDPEVNYERDKKND